MNIEEKTINIARKIFKYDNNIEYDSPQLLASSLDPILKYSWLLLQVPRISVFCKYGKTYYKDTKKANVSGTVINTRKYVLQQMNEIEQKKWIDLDIIKNEIENKISENNNNQSDNNDGIDNIDNVSNINQNDNVSNINQNDNDKIIIDEDDDDI